MIGEVSWEPKRKMSVCLLVFNPLCVQVYKPVKTEANGDPLSTVHMQGVLLGWLVGLVCALPAVVSPVQHIFFPHRTLFHFISNRLGRQSCRITFLLIHVSLSTGYWYTYSIFVKGVYISSVYILSLYGPSPGNMCSVGPSQA